MKNLKYLALVIIVVMTMVTVNQKEVFALSCAQATVQEDIDAASAIFVGKVTNIQTATPEKAANATFEVSEYWKGNVNKNMTVGGIYTWNGTTNPPIYFKVGENYLVFAKSVPNVDPNNLIASIDCGRTTLLSSASELKTTLGTSKVFSNQNVYLFSRNLSQGMSGEDVRELQKYLNEKGFTVTVSGAGSIGNETTYFGSATKATLIRFQTAHAAELGIVQGTGYFGPLTRVLVNK
ncbi:MAG: peptidoglycan-binding domain-containing protein [bacterium]